MKTKKIFFLLAAIPMITLTSCSNDDDESNSTNSERSETTTPSEATKISENDFQGKWVCDSVNTNDADAYKIEEFIIEKNTRGIIYEKIFDLFGNAACSISVNGNKLKFSIQKDNLVEKTFDIVKLENDKLIISQDNNSKKSTYFFSKKKESEINGDIDLSLIDNLWYCEYALENGKKKISNKHLSLSTYNSSLLEERSFDVVSKVKKITWSVNDNTLTINMDSKDYPFQINKLNDKELVVTGKWSEESPTATYVFVPLVFELVD